jgi:hypothetical protein
MGSTWRAGSWVSVYIYFGSPKPSQAAVSRAQAELDTMRVSAWWTSR